MPEGIEKLVELFVKFPGVGPRQARRFVYYLLNQRPQFIDLLIARLNAVRSEINQCKECYRFFPNKVDAVVCEVCRDQNLGHDTLIIVEKDVDFDALRKANLIQGRYFILGGLIPILEKNPERLVKINPLLEKVENFSTKGLQEVIFALSANPQGDHTVEILSEKLSPLRQKHDFKISTLGRGLSTGTELEYSDLDTLKSALENRK